MVLSGPPDWTMDGRKMKEGVWEKGAPFLTVFSGVREESIAAGFVHLFMVKARLSVCVCVCEGQRRAYGQETLSVCVYNVDNMKWSLSSFNTKKNWLKKDVGVKGGRWEENGVMNRNNAPPSLCGGAALT